MRLLAVLALLMLESRAASAQASGREPRHAWLVAGSSLIRLGDDLDFGPSVSLRAMLSHRFALSLDGSVLISGFGGDPKHMTALFGNAGPSWVWRGLAHELSFSLGASVATKWEDTGFPAGARGQSTTIGIFAGGGGVLWLGSHVGLSGQVRYHLWWGDPGVSGNVGMAFRW